MSLENQNVILIDLRGDGNNAHQEYNDFHIVGSVSFPHGWINRQNHFTALSRFKNLPNKMIVVLHENERRGCEVCKTLTEKDFGNVYLLTGGIQQFYIDYPGLV